MIALIFATHPCQKAAIDRLQRGSQDTLTPAITAERDRLLQEL